MCVSPGRPSTDRYRYHNHNVAHVPSQEKSHPKLLQGFPALSITAPARVFPILSPSLPPQRIDSLHIQRLLDKLNLFVLLIAIAVEKSNLQGGVDDIGITSPFFALAGKLPL